MTLKTTSSLYILLMVLFSQTTLSQTVNAEFGTLFTTPLERKIIDSNRYVKKTKKVKTVEVAKVEVEQPKQILYRTIEKEFKISGISIANSGENNAWVNGKLYESGDKIDEKIYLSVYPKQSKVRITVKNGKSFYGKSGDTIKVTYKQQIFE